MQFQVGQRVIYHTKKRGSGYESALHATVVNVGKRITIRIDGQPSDMRPTVVIPERLTVIE
jgi:hypothetical protein